MAWLGAAALLLCGCTMLWQVEPHDEGLMLAWAGRIADGQAPYRDFWCNYAPGQPLLLAGLVKLFGPSLLAWRVLRLAVDVVVVVLAYVLVRRRAGEGWAIAGSLATAGAMAFPAGPGPNATALALGLGAIVLAPRRALGAGALAGLACFFRPEIGIACAVGAVLETESRRVHVAAAAAAVAAVTLGPFVIALGGDMLPQTVGFVDEQRLQRLPFPLIPHVGFDPNKLLEFWMPLILVVGCAAWLALGRRRWALAPLAFVGLGYLLARADEFHLVPLSVALAVMLACAAAARTGPPRVVLGVLLALIAAHGVERQIGRIVHVPALAAVPGGVGDGVQTEAADAHALRALVPFVRSRVPSGRPVFVANPRFDLVHAGDPLLNVILDRPNPTRYDVMQPGVVTTAKVQREMVRELGSTRLVVVWHDPRATLREDNPAGRSSGVHILDAYLRTAFRPVARFGEYEVRRRR
ncbi:MAG TPA: hypothetical protein VH279_03220 [Solirubrobacteraceae bacterium]|nr:hypothetical protein [Solirubrobacteraceae bacterium]